MNVTYKKDKEGYVIIHYVYECSDEEEALEEEASDEHETVEEEEETPSDEAVEEELVDDEVDELTDKLSTLAIANDYDPSIVTLIKQKKLTKEHLAKVEFTELLRIAMYNDYASKFILDNFNLRGMPIKRTIKDGEGNMVRVELKNYQAQAVTWMKTREALPRKEHYGLRGGIICMKMGMGKCHGKGTPILMWDGTIKKVEDIDCGDLICGDDSTPREVLSLAWGVENMYKITPQKGDPYTVNESHILSLKISGNKGWYWSSYNNQYRVSWFDHSTLKFRDKSLGQNIDDVYAFIETIDSPDVIDICVRDFLSLSKTMQNRLKGYRVPVEWPEVNVPVDPYILGVWLGDGSSDNAEITNTDPEIVRSVYEWAETQDYIVNPKGSSITYSISGGFRVDLKQIGVLGNKHVPLVYKRNSEAVRLQVLAGLLDTDGYLTDGCFEITQKRKVLADDILYLARSCGFAAYMKPCEKSCTYKGKKRLGTYYRVYISGDVDRIPTKISYKKAAPRTQKKDVLVTNITIELLGPGKYYGFTLDGNHRYLLGDFTVTHNTLASLTHILSSPKRLGDFPTLVVASLTVAQEWKLSGVQKFFGNDLKVIYLHKDFFKGDRTKRTGLMAKIDRLDDVTRALVKQADLVITTYDACLSACKKGDWWEDCFLRGEDGIHKDKIIEIHGRTRSQADDPAKVGLEVIYATPWARVVADESQRFNNPKTALYKAMMAVYGEKKWCLTGTPVRNYETDIWAQLRFLGYNGIETATDWRRYGAAKYIQHNLKDAVFTMDYADANVKLPKLHEAALPTDLTENEQKIYQFILGETKGIYDQVLTRMCSFACVLAMFMRLRQCCIAPYLITAESKREKAKMTKSASAANAQASETVKKAMSKYGQWLHDKTGTAGYRSAKMTQVINTLKKIPKGEKALVFSSFTSCLDLLVDGLAELHPKFKHLMIDGDTKGPEREEILKRWRSDDSINGLFLTLKVGSEGLNLHEANHVIMIEPWWNDAVPSQAKARAWRTGQTREVYVHNIIVNESIEHKMLEVCRGKAELAAQYLEGTERKVSKKNGGLDMITLGRILGMRG